MKNLLSSLVLGSTIALSIVGCSNETTPKPASPSSYICSEFIDDEHISFFRHILRHNYFLRVTKSDGSSIIYQTGEGNLSIKSIDFYNNYGLLEKVIEDTDEEGRVEIAIRYQIDFTKYLSKIYQKKYLSKKEK